MQLRFSDVERLCERRLAGIQSMDLRTQSFDVGAEASVALLELGDLRRVACVFTVAFLDAAREAREVTAPPGPALDCDGACTLPVRTRVRQVIASTLGASETLACSLVGSRRVTDGILELSSIVLECVGLSSQDPARALEQRLLRCIRETPSCRCDQLMRPSQPLPESRQGVETFVTLSTGSGHDLKAFGELTLRTPRRFEPTFQLELVGSRTVLAEARVDRLKIESSELAGCALHTDLAQF